MPNKIPVVECENPDNLPEKLPVQVGDFRVGRFRTDGGIRSGCELIVADSDQARAVICTTRGMSLWRARLGGIDCQWRSPVKGPVHPAWVPLDDPSGIGWLDGFDELLVRCGLRSFGAPDFDDRGRLLYPLHGRIGNLPADNIQVELDQQTGSLVISGDVYETRFLVYNLRLRAEYRLTLGQPIIALKDRVTNLASVPASMQMLYHINFGQPVLSGGARLHLAAPQIVARDVRARADIETWATYLPPTSGYSEQVYFSQPPSDTQGWAHTLLTDGQSSRGVAVRFKSDNLPCFTQWKNTASEADGYVTGLEPGTGFPNPRSFEQTQGRVVELKAGECRDFEIEIEGVSQAGRIAQQISAIQRLQGDRPPRLLPSRPDWCG